MTTDLYTRVADRTGVNRKIVKELALYLAYSPESAAAEEEFEDRLTVLTRTFGRALKHSESNETPDSERRTK